MSKAINFDWNDLFSSICIITETGQPQILLNQDGKFYSIFVILSVDFDEKDEPLVDSS